MSVLAPLSPTEQQALGSSSFTERVLSVVVTTAQTSVEVGAPGNPAIIAEPVYQYVGANIFTLGMVNEPGWRWKSLHLIARDNVAQSTTEYYDFQPVIETDDGKETLLTEDVGSGVSSSSRRIIAGIPFRLHTQETLKEAIPAGARLGVRVTGVSAGSFVAAPLGIPLFTASIVYGG